MVAIPVGNDQPGVASRFKKLGVGEFLPLKRLNAAKLRPLLHRVLEQPTYRQCAQQVMDEIRKANGIQQAVQFIERNLN
jgi:UDP:flavonoid glycosyltransferase YjiC (YdhE family)